MNPESVRDLCDMGSVKSRAPDRTARPERSRAHRYLPPPARKCVKGGDRAGRDRRITRWGRERATSGHPESGPNPRSRATPQQRAIRSVGSAWMQDVRVGSDRGRHRQTHRPRATWSPGTASYQTALNRKSQPISPSNEDPIKAVRPSRNSESPSGYAISWCRPPASEPFTALKYCISRNLWHSSPTTRQFARGGFVST